MPVDLDELLRLAVQRQASDLHLKVGVLPVLRIDHQLLPLQDRPRLTQADLDAVIHLIATDRQRLQLEQRRELDLGAEHKIIEKSGSWFSYGGERIGQGRDNAKRFLHENPALVSEIEAKVRAALGMAGAVAAEASEAR